VDALPDKSRAREIVEAAVEGAVGMVPIAGSPLAVAFTTAVNWSYNKRMQAWLNDLAKAVTTLQASADEWPPFEQLAENDVFLDAVAQATRAAQATHQVLKLEALRNGVLNSIGSDAPTVDEQARFFRLAEELTASHIRLLKFFDEPGAFFDSIGVPRPSGPLGFHIALAREVPEFAALGDLLEVLVGDLGAAGLTHTIRSNVRPVLSMETLWRPVTTPLGRRFLAFISSPHPVDAAPA
jgi:hypothetical protein